MHRRMRSAAALSAAAALLSGCFSYRQADVSTVPAGQEVRLFLAPGADVELPDGVPPSPAGVRGRIIERDAGRLTLRIPVTEQRPGYLAPELGQDVRIAITDVVDVQRRELDVQRSALLVGGAAGVAAALLLVITDEAGEPSPEPGPSPEVIRIPLFTLPTP